MTANTTYAILAVLSGIMIVDTRAKHVLVGYVAIAIVATIMALSGAAATLSGLLLFSVATVLKVVAAPIGLLWFIRLNPEPEDLRASAPLPVRVLVVIALIALSRAVSRLPGVGGLPLQSTVAFVVLCGIAWLFGPHRHFLGALTICYGFVIGWIAAWYSVYRYSRGQPGVR